jgi:L,D-peptidoglycan transpeptidase YkuD (ErfK/YbiS/YcfS/YnhG family)/LmbE family N-acetylglucosaminyl deacetylase
MRSHGSAAVVSLVLGLAVMPGVPDARAAEPDCPAGTTLLVSAHEDDDLLFMSPDVIHEIRAGRCVRTVYVTAGDDNLSESYWRGREAGVQAAYAVMAGVRDSWTTSDAGLPGRSVPVVTLTDAPRVSLEFLRVPDGFPGGAGGSVHGHESLQKLWQRTIAVVHPVDGGAGYTKQGLLDTLTTIMNGLQPDRIFALDDLNPYGSGDHSDHTNTAFFTRAAAWRYTRPHTYLAFRGYKVNDSPANVSGADLAVKKSAFYEYATHDPNVCASDQACVGRGYAGYLPRRYLATSGTGTVHPEELRGGGSVRQLVTVTARSGSSTVGTAVAWQKRNYVWQVAQGPFRVQLGSRGLVEPGLGRQLTGQTPEGAFRPARALGFKANPGTTLPYRRLGGGDSWPYDPLSPATYNVLQPRRSAGAGWRTSLSQRFADHRARFPWAVLMDYNLPRGVHRSSGQLQAGTVADVTRGSFLVHAGDTLGRLGWSSMPASRLRALLGWMQPERQRTTFFVGTPAYLRTHL